MFVRSFRSYCYPCSLSLYLSSKLGIDRRRKDESRNVTEMYNPFSFFFPSNKKEGFQKEKELYKFVTFWDSSGGRTFLGKWSNICKKHPYILETNKTLILYQQKVSLIFQEQICSDLLQFRWRGGIAENRVMLKKGDW